MHDIIHSIATVVGYISTILLIGCMFLFVISLIRKDRVKAVDASVKASKMPVLRPIPIPTANQASPIDRLIVWVFSVRKWQLEESFVFEFKGVSYFLHAGFEFDGASIPRPLWAILSPIGLLLIPGLLHDYGYRYNGIFVLNDAGEPEWSTDINGRKAWDELFKDIGDEVNGMFLLNAMATLGLLIGGFAAWKSARNRDETIPDI